MVQRQAAEETTEVMMILQSKCKEVRQLLIGLAGCRLASTLQEKDSQVP